MSAEKPTIPIDQTCYFAGEACPRCGQEVATNGKGLFWCGSDSCGYEREEEVQRHFGQSRPPSKR